jgi:DNA topoisomerase-1
MVESTSIENTGAEKNKLFPTSVAYLLNDFLVKYFSEIVDYQFTAKLESDFDTIATQNVPWQGVVKNFYKPFHQKVEDAADISREETHGMRELGTDPKSGKPVSVRFGRYGDSTIVPFIISIFWYSRSTPSRVSLET